MRLCLRTSIVFRITHESSGARHGEYTEYYQYVGWSSFIDCRCKRRFPIWEALES